MNKSHAHIHSAEINKWIAGTLKLPTYLWPCGLHGAHYTGQTALASIHATKNLRISLQQSFTALQIATSAAELERKR